MATFEKSLILKLIYKANVGISDNQCLKPDSTVTAMSQSHQLL